MHGLTFGGHPVSCAVALANLDLLASEGIVEHVDRAGPGLGARLRNLLDLPLVGDVRGDGFFWALELVKDPDDHSVRFTPAEKAALTGDLVGPRLAEAGLICRADSRADPIVQLAPVLTCGDAELDEIEQILRVVLTGAGKELADLG